METNIDYDSLLEEYNDRMEQQFTDFLHDMSEAIRWQLILQARDLDENGNDYYESSPFKQIKQNFHHGTLTYEYDIKDPPFFALNHYIPARYSPY